MSKLQDLINRLCPNGVPFQPLGEVCEFKRGQTITEKSAVEGNVPVIAEVLPPMGLFGNAGTRRAEKKQNVVRRFKEFFDRFFDISGGNFSLLKNNYNHY